MYLTVCPHRGPGHDSSVGEWVYLTVCPLCGPSHYSSVGEWMYLTVCPLCGPGSGHGGVFQGIFPWAADHTLPTHPESVRQKMGQPVNMKEEGWNPNMNGENGWK